MTEANSSEIISIILAGVGGQGILLSSEIAARAAMLAGYDVKTNEVHGMAQRGGSVIAQIRYGKEVFSPLVPPGTARVLGAFEAIEALRYTQLLAPGGLAAISKLRVIPVTVSSGAAKYPEDPERLLADAFSNLLLLDADAIAQQAGNRRCANTVILGAISNALTLPLDSWKEALAACISEKHRDVNLKAFAAGRAQSASRAA